MAVMAWTWPEGVTSAGVACGIKESGTPDLGLLAAAEPLPWAGTFTRNGAAAAPVGWCRSRLGSPVRAIVVNSGNANACTGAAGERAVEDVASAAGRTLDCRPDEILVASTGPIGVELPTEAITSHLEAARSELGHAPEPFAKAILTTDTVIKLAAAESFGARVCGVAKGAAMVAPSMATMLAFLVTDAAVGPAALGAALGTSVDKTFNRICIDGCESTNDSVFLLATGTGSPLSQEHLDDAVGDVCAALARAIVEDAEGASRVMRVIVRGAPDEASAVALGRAVASSALWRAAVAGGDPNWGRVLAAMGSVDRDLDIGGVELTIGGTTVFARGRPAGSLADAAVAMKSNEIELVCAVGGGAGEAEVLSSDLTTEYVRLNSEVST